MAASVTSSAAAAELLARRNARTNMLDFTRYTFPGYRANWHHKLLCRYLDDFVAGDIKRLIVSMPPRHGKSELVSRRLPAFILGRNPNASVMATSYAASLSQRFNRDVQRIIDSPRYHNLFPDTTLNGSNVRTVAKGSWLRNSDLFEVVEHRGVYRNAGVGGGITGMGFQYGIIDDPVKDAREANSPTVRSAVAEWFDSTFYTRQQKGAGILLTMTRWHTDDLAGRLIERMHGDDGEEWVLLTLPAVQRKPESSHPDDPRSYGDALWPTEYTPDYLAKVEAQNKFVFSALYQQNPIPQGSGLFETSNIEIINHTPECKDIVRFYDLAVTAKKHSDYTAGVKLGITNDETLIVLDVYRVQKNPTQVEADIAQNAQIDGKPCRIRLEAEKAGIIQLDYLLRRKDLRGYRIDAKAPKGDKYTRAQPVASRVNTGRLKLVRGGWNRAFIDELAVFPMGAHDDQVDALSGAYDMLSNTYTTVEWSFA